MGQQQRAQWLACWCICACHSSVSWQCQLQVVADHHGSCMHASAQADMAQVQLRGSAQLYYAAWHTLMLALATCSSGGAYACMCRIEVSGITSELVAGHLPLA